jgi:hypothetical protein
MAVPILLAGPDFPAAGASPATHLAWCEAFGLYCARQVQLAREYDLPTRKWLHAAELAAFAAGIWRERAGGITP